MTFQKFQNIFWRMLSRFSGGMGDQFSLFIEMGRSSCVMNDWNFSCTYLKIKCLHIYFIIKNFNDKKPGKNKKPSKTHFKNTTREQLFSPDAPQLKNIYNLKISGTHQRAAGSHRLETRRRKRQN